MEKKNHFKDSNFVRYIYGTAWFIFLAFAFITDKATLLPHYKKYVFAVGAIISAIHLITPTLTFIEYAKSRNEFYGSGIWFLGKSLIGSILTFTFFFYFTSDVIIYSFLISIGVSIFYFSINHISLQHFGILKLIDDKNKEKITIKILSDKVFCLFMASVMVPITWIKINIRFGETKELFNFVDSVPNFYILFLVLAALLAKLFKDYKDQRLFFDRTIYLFLIAVQPLIFLYMRPIYGYIVYSLQHWIIEIYFSARLQSRFNFQTEFFAKYLFRSLLIGGVFYFFAYYLFTDTKNLTDLLAFQVDVNISDYNSIFKTAVLSFAVWIIYLHFYLSRIIYSKEENQNLLK